MAARSFRFSYRQTYITLTLQLIGLIGLGPYLVKIFLFHFVQALGWMIELFPVSVVLVWSLYTVVTR